MCLYYKAKQRKMYKKPANLLSKIVFYCQIAVLPYHRKIPTFMPGSGKNNKMTYGSCRLDGYSR